MTAVVMGFFILFTILTFALRLVMIPGSYGQIPLEIPVVSAPVQDPGFHTFQESPREGIRNTTPTVVLTADAFFFGDVAAFSLNLADSRNKFVVRHVDGAPQVPLLVQTMHDWLKARAFSANVPLTKSLILIPAGNIPIPIVIQVVAQLRESPLFQHVILSNGLI